MSISVGGIDLTTAIINVEYETLKLQQLLDWMRRNNPGMRWPDGTAMAKFDSTALEVLQKKYPEAGIAPKK